MRIFVTGHKGFIGTHLTRVLEDMDVIVSGYDLKDGNDIRDYDNLRQKMHGHDVVIHLAAFVSVPGSWENPSECFEHNVQGTINVARAAVECGVKGVVYASSAAIYDDKSSPYALSKKINEDIFKMYGTQLDSIGLRFFNIYGPGQNSEYSGVIPVFIDNIKRTGEVIIFGDGKQTRDFIHVSDVVNAIVKASQAKFGDRTGSIAFDVGTGQSITVEGLARILADLLESPLSFMYKEARKEVRFSEADTNLAHFIINFTSSLELREGLDRFLKGN